MYYLEALTLVYWTTTASLSPAYEQKLIKGLISWSAALEALNENALQRQEIKTQLI